MNILVNILFFSIFFFLLASESKSIKTWKKKHLYFRQDFHQETQKKMSKYIQSQKGQITSIGILASFLLSIIIIIQLFIFLKYFTAAKSRANAYLCAKYNIINVNKSIQEIGRLNISIILANSLMLSPQTFQAGQTLKKISSLAQEKFYLSFIKKFTEQKFCSIQNNLIWAKSFPYDIGPNFLLKRKVSGLASSKENEWYHYAISSPPQIAFDQSFVLKIKYAGFFPTALRTYLSSEELSKIKD